MFRETMLLGAAIAAFVALAAPAAQAEDPVVTNESGEPAWHVTGAGVDVTFTAPFGFFNCTTVTLTITLDENTNGTASGSGTGDATGNALAVPPTHAGHCVTEPAGVLFAFTSVTLKEFHLENNGGSAHFGFTFDITHPVFGPLPCGFTGTADLSYTTGDDTITLSNGHLTGTKNLTVCAGEGSLYGAFNLTDENGGTVVLD